MSKKQNSDALTQIQECQHEDAEAVTLAGGADAELCLVCGAFRNPFRIAKWNHPSDGKWIHPPLIAALIDRLSTPVSPSGTWRAVTEVEPPNLTAVLALWLRPDGTPGAAAIASRMATGQWEEDGSVDDNGDPPRVATPHFYQPLPGSSTPVSPPPKEANATAIHDQELPVVRVQGPQVEVLQPDVMAPRDGLPGMAQGDVVAPPDGDLLGLCDLILTGIPEEEQDEDGLSQCLRCHVHTTLREPGVSESSPRRPRAAEATTCATRRAASPACLSQALSVTPARRTCWAISPVL